MNISRRQFIGSTAAFCAGAASRVFADIEAPSRPPALVFGVLSDLHVRVSADGRTLAPGYDCATFIHALKYFRDRNVDAVVISGDLADKGMVEELQAVGEAWNKVFPGSMTPDGRKVEKVFITGNHDCGGFKYDGGFASRIYPDKDEMMRHVLCSDMKGWWERIFDEPFAPIYRKEIKGYSFIGAHWCGYRRNGREMPAFRAADEWLSVNGRTLDPSLPFFYCQHPHPYNTVYGPWVLNDRGVAEKGLRNFPNAVAISGHSHFSLTDERSIWQGGFTSIAAGSLRYTGIPVSRYPGIGYENSAGGGELDPIKAMPVYNSSDGRQGLIVRVWSDCMAICRHEFVKDCDLGDEWVVPLPFSEAKPFSFKARVARSSAPVFPLDAKLEVVRIRAKNRGGRVKAAKGRPDSKATLMEPVEKDMLRITFPKAFATASKRPMEYELSFSSASGADVVLHVLADGFNQPASDPRTKGVQTCTVAIDRLPPAPLDLKVRAVSSLELKSVPLCASIPAA